MAKINKSKVKNLLSQEERASRKKTGLFFLFYSLLVIAIYNVRIFNNFKRAFLMLTGKINFWFVFSKSGEVVPLPDPTGPTGPLPTYPEPDLEIKITSWGYWREVINIILRGFFLVAMILMVIWIIIFILRRLEVRSKSQTTILYKVYTNTLRAPINNAIRKIDRAIAYLMKSILKKGNITLMILITLAINGVLAQILVGLSVTVYSLFITGPINWFWLHFKAIIYFAIVFLSKFTAFNIFLTLFLIYNLVAFIYAYNSFRENEIKQEEFVDALSFGVGLAGGSGKGKTLTGKTLSDAAQRSAKKFVLSDNKDTENAYSGLIQFSDARYFFKQHQDNILDEIDAEAYSIKFIEKHKIKNDHIDRFLGQTPDLYEQLKWYFIGMWILKKETKLIQSPIPTIINDPSSSKEVRDTIFDILTLRREDVYSLKLDQNLVKSSLDNIESEVDSNDERTFKLKEGVKPEDVNLSAHPGLTIFWPELDKDFPFSERGAILEAKIDKLLGIFRHFTAFKQKTIGHFIYDSQQRDGVANIVRTKFDSVLRILRQDKGKRSIFLIPYIKFVENRLKMYQRIMDLIIEGAPYKKSFFRVFIEWRLRRLTRYRDYLHSFDYIDMFVTLTDAGGTVIDDGGKAVKRLRINLANAYFTFPSVVYQGPYKEAKTRFPVKSVKHLKSWDSLEMNLEDIKDIKSDFLGEVFLGVKKQEKEKPKKRKKNRNISEDDLL